MQTMMIVQSILSALGPNAVVQKDSVGEYNHAAQQNMF